MDLDGVIAEMYASICFEEGQRPDWSRQVAIFAPDARMVRVTDDGIYEFDLQSYRVNLEAMINSRAHVRLPDRHRPVHRSPIRHIAALGYGPYQLSNL